MKFQICFIFLTSSHLFAYIGTQHHFRMGSHHSWGLSFKGELPGVTWENTPNFNEKCVCFPLSQNLKSNPAAMFLCSGSPGLSWVVPWLQAFLGMNKMWPAWVLGYLRDNPPICHHFYGIFKKLAHIYSFFSVKKIVLTFYTSSGAIWQIATDITPLKAFLKHFQN